MARDARRPTIGDFRWGSRRLHRARSGLVSKTLQLGSRMATEPPIPSLESQSLLLAPMRPTRPRRPRPPAGSFFPGVFVATFCKGPQPAVAIDRRSSARTSSRALQGFPSLASMPRLASGAARPRFALESHVSSGAPRPLATPFNANVRRCRHYGTQSRFA